MGTSRGRHSRPTNVSGFLLGKISSFSRRHRILRFTRFYIISKSERRYTALARTDLATFVAVLPNYFFPTFFSFSFSVFQLVITLPLPAPAAIHGVALAAASTSFTPGERAEEGSAGRVYFSQSRELGETAPRSQLRAKAHAPARSSLTVDRLAHSLADDLIGLPGKRAGDSCF